ncbi:MAG TPA: SGNH/GDSL hydrolase family protein [Ohtaekwangia sp.]|nr:SGNH/GDSL hydrolase family protein [Ohtaekwangia sp.]
MKRHLYHLIFAGFFALVISAAAGQDREIVRPETAKGKNVKKDSVKFFPPDNRNILYTGRVDFTNRKKPRFWAPGVYITTKFLGPSCEVALDDEASADSHNTIEVIIDEGTPFKVRLKGKKNVIKVAEGLSDGVHTLTIVKNTEGGVGYIEFLGLRCRGLMPSALKPERTIEFIGNSITAGSGLDASEIPCGKGTWFDQHNAYMSYGPVTARTLNAQWHLSAVSGIGLIHSCCGINVTMPKVYDKINQHEGTVPWEFRRYQPDVITVCLGENDGVQDSVKFTTAYVNFVTDLRSHYPKAQIVCLTSPMANATLSAVLKNYITGVVNHHQQQGDKNVSKYFFSKSFNSGCGGHPGMAEHQQIAQELSAYLASLMNWD